MSDPVDQPATLLNIVLDADSGTPARILDLFTAQARLPEAFEFRRIGKQLRLRILTPAMPVNRYAILAAKLHSIDGVCSVEAQSNCPVPASAQ